MSLWTGSQLISRESLWRRPLTPTLSPHSPSKTGVDALMLGRGSRSAAADVKLSGVSAKARSLADSTFARMPRERLR